MREGRGERVYRKAVFGERDYYFISSHSKTKGDGVPWEKKKKSPVEFGKAKNIMPLFVF